MNDCHTIAVVEDDALVAKSLRNLLLHLGHDVVGQADTGAAAVELAARLRPDVVLMDIGLGGEIDGIEAARAILAADHAAVVFVSGISDGATAARAALVGGHGYITKPPSPDQLRVAIEFACSQRQREPKLEPPPEANGSRAMIATLSSREREILSGIARGLSTAQTAAALGVEVRTVEFHRANLRRKLGIGDVAGLTRCAVKHGICSLADD